MESGESPPTDERDGDERRADDPDGEDPHPSDRDFVDDTGSKREVNQQNVDPTASDRSGTDPTASDRSDADPTASDRSDTDPTASNRSGTDPTASDRSDADPTDDGPTPEPGSTAAVKTTPGTNPGLVHRFFNDQNGPLMWIREFLSSAAVVLAIGLLLFGISGVWPPMVAIESGSMEPNMQKGDLIFVTDPGRFAPDAASNEPGVVTYEEARDAEYRTFGLYGSVIVFDEPANTGSPIIHRAHLYVTEGENWYERADGTHLNAENCEELRNCPAPASGFITKGDDNPRYDQAQGIAPIVQAEWITGVARLRIPYLGWIRLLATGQATILGGMSGVSGGTSLLIAGISSVAIGRETQRRT